MSRPRALLQNLGVALVSLLLTLLALEAAARILAWRWTRLPNAVRTPFARYDPLLGWVKPPGARGWLVRPEYRVWLEVNAHGLRGPERPYDKPAGTRRVLLLGDSFTEGYTVEESASVRARLEAELQAPGCGAHEVLNGGTAAWGTDQEYLFYRYEGRRYRPDVVALLFYYNDLYGDGFGDVGKPWFELEGDDDRLVLRGSPVPEPRRAPTPENMAFRLTPWRGSYALRLLSQRTRARPELNARLARLGLVEPLPDGEDELPAELNPFGPRNPREVRGLWRTTAAILRELGRDVRADGGELLVFYVPARFEVDDRSWELTRARYHLGQKRWSRDKVYETLREICAGLDLALVDPRPDMRAQQERGRPSYYPLDGHWTATGHELAAQALARELRARGLDGCRRTTARREDVACLGC
jgi:hypothetical protein